MLLQFLKRLVGTGEPKMDATTAVSMKKILLAGAAISGFLASNAIAQVGSLDEIVVTATKREQAAHDVPLALETVTGERLENYNINDFRDLSSSIPNFVVTEGITASTIAIRGVGTGQDRSFEQAVAMFIDGVYMPRSRQYRSPFFDVERIEVVRGPQAVLFGLNATAGAVSIVSAQTKPGDDLTARAFAEYNVSHDGVTTGGVVGGSIGDTLGIRIAAQYTEGGGYYENTFLNRNVGNADDILVRGTFVFEPSDYSTFVGRVSYSDYEIDGLFGEIFGGVATVIEPTDGIVDFRRSSDGSTIDPLNLFAGPDKHGTYADSLNLSLQADIGIAEHTLTAIVARSEFDYNLITDLDTTSLAIFDTAVEEEYEQTSLEIRVASPAGNKTEYLVGVYYHDWQDDQRNPVVFGPDFFGPDNGLFASTTFRQEAQLFSVFGSLTFNFSDDFRITAGARWVTEDKDVFRDSQCNFLVFSTREILDPGAFAIFCADPALDLFTATRSSENFMPEVVLQYDVNENIMLYGRVGESAKSGGFAAASDVTISTIEYGDEKATGYEFGMKALIGGIAEVNIAAFRSKFEDLQVNSFLVDLGPPFIATPVIANAAEAVTQGVELDGRVAPTDWLSIGGSIAYLDAEFDSFPAAPCNSVATPLPSGFCDISGERLPFAAMWSGNFSADVEHTLQNDWEWFAGVNLSFSSDYFTEGTVDPTVAQDDYTRISARVGVEYDKRFRLEAIGTNLTDEIVLGTSQPFGSYNLAYPEPPRTWSVRASIIF